MEPFHIDDFSPALSIPVPVSFGHTPIIGGKICNDNNTLYNLIDKKDWDEVRKFLSTGPTGGSEDDFMQAIVYQPIIEFGTTTLILAITKSAPTDIITSLIDKGGKDLVMVNKDKNKWTTALHWACREGASVDVEVVKHLLDVGGDELIVIKDDGGKTALAIAKHYNASAEVKDAIRTFDFNTNIKSNRLNLGLLESFVNGWGIDGLFTRLNDEGSPPIKLIAESNPSVDATRYIIEKGAVEMGETEKYRDKYPTLRSEWNHLLEKALISATKEGDPDRCGVLMSLVNKEYWGAIRVFMMIESIQSDTRKKNVFHRDSDNDDKNTVLHVAMKHFAPFDTVKQLSEYGGKELTLIQNEENKTAYEIACEVGANSKIIEFLSSMSNEETLFLAKYRIPNTHAIHKSATSVVMRGDCANTNKRVAVKFIRNYEHYQKEHEHRERVKRLETDENGRPLLVPIIDSFNSEEDVRQESPEAFKIKESMKFMKAFDVKKTKVKLSLYKYAIVMNLADRNLDAIYREENLTSICVVVHCRMF